jgi:hypothetical protein
VRSKLAENPKVPEKKQEWEKGEADPNRKLKGGKKMGKIES